MKKKYDDDFYSDVTPTNDPRFENQPLYNYGAPPQYPPQQPYQYPPQQQYQQQQRDNALENVFNILTAIIYPVILFLIAIFVGTFNPLVIIVSLMGNVIFAISVLISGFYLIIVPLPIITLFRFGMKQNKLSTGIKILIILAGVACASVAFFLTMF